MTTADLLLIPAAPLQHATSTVEREPPLAKAIEISPGIYLGGVDTDVARAVMHVCKFRELEGGDDKAMYGFARFDPPGERWDQDQAISRALYLSHLVHPHRGAFEFSARVKIDEKGRVVDVAGSDTMPSFARAYTCVGVRRPWLTQSDGELLRDVIRAYDAARDYLKDKRLGMAVSLFAQSPFISYGRARIALLAAALEGLVSTSPERALKQFVVRVHALAAEAELNHFDRGWAERMYKLRSKLAHGAALLQVTDDEQLRLKADELNAAMFDLDELLRRVLRRALLDEAFANRIQHADSTWPVSRKGCPKCRSIDQGVVEIQCPGGGSKWQ
jgi:hypothetical protein